MGLDPRRRTVVSYAAEWDTDELIPPEQFSPEVGREKVMRLYRYSEDP